MSHTMNSVGPYVTQGGGLQRINSHLLDDGAPESLRFLGVWNCLMQLG